MEVAAMFGKFAGIYQWFPKMFDRFMNNMPGEWTAPIHPSHGNWPATFPNCTLGLMITARMPGPPFRKQSRRPNPKRWQ
jgi:heme/copper-type cytochrome/quinol oxidase subunit 1